jgi:hypothetical protein
MKLFPLTSTLLAGWLAVLLQVLSQSAAAGVPYMPPATFPGTKLGAVEGRWIAPWVYSFSSKVGEHRFERTVRWYDANGVVIKELSGLKVSDFPDFVTEWVDDRFYIHGVYSSWKFELPRKAAPGMRPGFHCARGEIFLDRYYVRLGESMIDVYDHGKLAGTAGPFRDHRDQSLAQSDDGCTALMTWKDAEKKIAQAVVIGPNAAIRCRVDCGEDARAPFTIAGGKGALLEIEGRRSSEAPEVPFRYVGADGETREFSLPPNARPLVSLPSTDLVLFASQLQNERFLLVHVRTGKVVWDVPSPVRMYPSVSTQAMVVKDKGQVLLLGLDMAALDLETGKAVALWENKKEKPMFGRLVQAGDDLYIISALDFFKLNLEDIEAKRNGWK